MAAGLPVRMLQAMTIERRCLIPIVTQLATSPRAGRCATLANG
jgi:hypothetical protein